MSLSQKTIKWLANNACISLKGKTAVVTGSNSGVGFKTAETLIYMGAKVILACRNLQKAKDAKAGLEADYPDSEISVEELDIADFSSIDGFVERLTGQKTDIHIFVNNAGIFHQPEKTTRDGFELVMGTNYFGVYYLTEKLLPYLSSLPHEVTYINTISLIHKAANIDYEDFYHEKNYKNLAVYARSKLCLAKYSYYLANRMKDSNVKIYMNHPGIAITPLGIKAYGPVVGKSAEACRRVFNSPEKSSLSVSYILSRKVPVGSVVGPYKYLSGWGYPRVNRTVKKVRTGAEELISFTEKEIQTHQKH